MTVKVIPIVVSALGMVPKVLEQRLGELEIKERIKTISITALLKSSRILRNSWRPKGTRHRADFKKSPPASLGGKNSQGTYIIIIPNKEKNQNGQRKGNLQILGNIGSRHYQTSGED